MVAGAGGAGEGCARREGEREREGTRVWVWAGGWGCVEGGMGASPKMKNLMKAPRRRMMESWPRRKPWVKERLLGGVSIIGGEGEGELWGGRGRRTRIAEGERRVVHLAVCWSVEWDGREEEERYFELRSCYQCLDGGVRCTSRVVRLQR